MYLDSLETTGFRNLAGGPVRFSPGRNLVLGGNGQGKTNLLEAITVLGTLRSFRTPHLRRAVRHGGRGFVLRGSVMVREGRIDLAQEVEFAPSLRRRLLVGGSEVSAADYLSSVRVEVLTGRREDLVLGEPGIRRAFLDRLSFQLMPRVYDLLRSYRRVLGQRNAWLRRGGTPAEAEAWEAGLAEAAAEIVVVRRRTVEAITPVFRVLLSDLPEELRLDVELGYRAESALAADGGADALAKTYRMMYHSARERDGRLGFTGNGPHRHDMLLTVGGRPAAENLSTGQAKLVAALLRLAAVELAERARPSDGPGIVVMDDADSELDETAFRALLERVGGERQVILSSPRGREVRRMIGADAVFWLRHGTVLREADLETTHDGTLHSR